MDDLEKGIKKITLEFETDVPAHLFDHNARENIIDHFKTTFQSRCYNIFYINSIDCEPLLNNELPLVLLHGDSYKMRVNLDTEVILFNVGEIVLLTLMIDVDEELNQTTVFGVNTYLSCKIDLNSRQIIEVGHNNSTSLKDTIYNKVYNPGDKIQVKITVLLNNQIDNGFSSRINCEGCIV